MKDGSAGNWQQNFSETRVHSVRLLEPFALTIVFGIAGCLVGGLVVLIPLTPSLLAAFVAGGVLIAAILRNKLYGLLLLTVVSFINTSFTPVLFELSEFSVRVHDLLFGLVVISLLIELVMSGKLRVPVELSRVVVPVLVFIIYIGLTLLNIYGTFPDHLGASAASFLRLAQYVLLIPLTCLTLKSEREVTQFVEIFAFLGLMNIVIGFVQSFSGPGLLNGRVDGLLGINALGLASGLVFLLGVIQYFERPFRSGIVAWLLLGGGLLGLTLTKSMSSTLATVATVCLYRLVHSKRDLLLMVRGILICIIGLSVFAFLLYSFRPRDSYGLQQVTGGSFVHRSIVGLAGIGIFLEHPFFGIGWQASSLTEVIARAELNHWLRHMLPTANSYLFPDVLPTSVHNFYIQILSELGLVGVFIFSWTIVRLVQVITKIIKNLQPHSPLRAYGQFFGFALIFLLIWWNTNPLYGGQIETFLCFSFLGAIPALARIGRQRG